MYDASEDLQHERPDTAKKSTFEKKKNNEWGHQKNQKTRLWRQAPETEKYQ